MCYRHILHTLHCDVRPLITAIADAAKGDQVDLTTPRRPATARRGSVDRHQLRCTFGHRCCLARSWRVSCGRRAAAAAARSGSTTTSTAGGPSGASRSCSSGARAGWRGLGAAARRRRRPLRRERRQPPRAATAGFEGARRLLLAYGRRLHSLALEARGGPRPSCCG